MELTGKQRARLRSMANTLPVVLYIGKEGVTDATEKGIARQIGLAESTTHQHVVAIFRKYGVKSRAGLMSLWLNRSGGAGSAS